MVTESVVAEIQKKIEEAFGVFDHDRGNTVDVRYFTCDLSYLLSMIERLTVVHVRAPVRRPLKLMSD